jgi:hypothetical protein
MTGLVHKPSKEALDKLHPEASKPKPVRKPCPTPYKRWNDDELAFVIQCKALGVDDGTIASALGLTWHQVRNRIGRHKLGPKIREEKARIAEQLINECQEQRKAGKELRLLPIFRI